MGDRDRPMTDQDIIDDPAYGSFMGLYDEAVEANEYDEKGYPQAGPTLEKPGGGVETRAIVYWSVVTNTLLEAMNGERITASDNQIATAVWSMSRDTDAWNFLKEELDIERPIPAYFGAAMYSAGYRDKALVIQQAWNSSSGQAYNEEVFDEALIAAASLGVGAGYNAVRYGTVRGLRALPEISKGAGIPGAWQATEGVQYTAPGLVRLVNGLLKTGISRGHAMLLAGHGWIYGKIPTSAVPYMYGIERTLRNPSMRKAFSWFVAANFLPVPINEAFLTADQYGHPDTWDEEERKLLQINLEKQLEAGVVDPDTLGAAAALGIVIEQDPGAWAAEQSSQDEWKFAEMAQGAADERALNAQFGPQLEETGERGIPFEAMGEAGVSILDYMGANLSSRLEGVAQLRSGDDIVFDEAGNMVSINLDMMPEGLTDEQQAAYIRGRIEQESRDTATEDPLLGIPPKYDELGSGEGFWAQQGKNVVRYDETMEAVASGELTPDQGRGRNRSTAIHGGPNTPVAVQATYRGSMARDTIYNMTTAQLESFQDMAIRAGLINRSNPQFVHGSRDQQTLDAMMTVMGHANNTGRSWRGQLEAMGSAYQNYLREQEELKEKDKPPKPLFVPSAPYSPLDDETIRQGLQDDIEKRLGRSANDFEMAEFASYLEQNHRANYDSQIAAEKAIWEAKGRANLGEDPGPLPQMEQIDEQARYQAKFEERYEDELREVDRWDRMKKDTNTLFRSLDNLTGAMGSSP